MNSRNEDLVANLVELPVADLHDDKHLVHTSIVPYGTDDSALAQSAALGGRLAQLERTQEAGGVDQQSSVRRGHFGPQSVSYDVPQIQPEWICEQVVEIRRK